MSGFDEFVRSRQGVQFFALADEAFRAVVSIAKSLEKLTSPPVTVTAGAAVAFAGRITPVGVVHPEVIDLTCKRVDLKTLRHALTRLADQTEDEVLRARADGMLGVVQQALDEMGES